MVLGAALKRLSDHYLFRSLYIQFAIYSDWRNRRMHSRIMGEDLLTVALLKASFTLSQPLLGVRKIGNIAVIQRKNWLVGFSSIFAKGEQNWNDKSKDTTIFSCLSNITWAKGNTRRCRDDRGRHCRRAREYHRCIERNINPPRWAMEGTCRILSISTASLPCHAAPCLWKRKNGLKAW